MESYELRLSDLSRFTGTTERFRSVNPNVIYTPGVKHIADNAGAYWLIDAIASHYCSAKMKQAMARDQRLESLQFWHLDVRPDDTARLYAIADTGEESFISQDIHRTDFPLPQVAIWAGFDCKRWTLLLPSEY